MKVENMTQDKVSSLFEQVLRKEISISEFEKWVYDSSDILESYFDKERYLDLISFDYRGIKYSDLIRFLNKFIDLAEAETARVLSLLKRVDIDSPELENVIMLLGIEFRDKGYYFLEDYYNLWQSDKDHFITPYYWKLLNESNRGVVFDYYDNRRKYFGVKLKTITIDLINSLKSGEIKIITPYNGVENFVKFDSDGSGEDVFSSLFNYSDKRESDRRRCFDSVSMEDFYKYSNRF